MLEVQILNLNPSFDHTGIIKHKVDGDVVRVDEVIEFCSGKGINMARVLKTLGYENYEVSNIIGGPIGKIIKDSLCAEGISSWNFMIENNSRINYALVDEINDKTLMINEGGPLTTKKEKQKYLEELYSWLKEKQIMVLAGSAMQGFDCKDIEEIIRKAKAKEMFVVVDTYGDFLSAGLQAGIDFLKINRKEFIAKFDSNNKQSFRLTQDFVKIFKKEKIKEVAITFDKEGALFYKSGLAWCGKIKKNFPKYNIGSGDSFLAGYIYSLVNNFDKFKCFKIAMACVAANTLIYGAGKLKQKDVLEIEGKYIEINKYSYKVA